MVWALLCGIIFFPGMAFANPPKTVSPPSISNQSWFSPFDGTDWLLLGGMAGADLVDFATSNYMSRTSRMEDSICLNNGSCQPPYGKAPAGEGNPLITGLYGTKYPRTWQYASWFSGEFALQSLLVYALPKRWRNIGMGIFIGIGITDMVGNGYSAGLGFRF